MATWLKSLERRYGFDLRSLALLRIGLALALMRNLLGHGGEVWNGAVGWQLGFAIATVTTLLLLIGYRTRWATLISWVLLVSLPYHQPQIISQTDNLLQTVLFWTLFLPLGSSYSVDQALNLSPRAQPQKILTIANLGLLLQLGLIAIVLIQTRSLGVGLLLCITSLALIPSFIWNHWTTFSPQQLGLKIYYDADCGFCKKVVHLLRTFLVLPYRVPLQTAQSDPVIQTAMETHNSWVIVDWQGGHHYKWQGIAYVVSLSPLVWPLAQVLRWPPLMTAGTRLYETIANNRRFAGNFTRPFKFQSFTVQSSGMLNLISGLVLLLLVSAHIHQFTTHPDIAQRPMMAVLHWITTPGQWLAPLLRMPHIDQVWGMDRV